MEFKRDGDGRVVLTGAKYQQEPWKMCQLKTCGLGCCKKDAEGGGKEGSYSRPPQTSGSARQICE